MKPKDVYKILKERKIDFSYKKKVTDTVEDYERLKKRREKWLDRTIKELCLNTDAYELVYEQLISVASKPGQIEWLHVENLVNKRGHELREMLHIRG